MKKNTLWILRNLTKGWYLCYHKRRYHKSQCISKYLFPEDETEKYPEKTEQFYNKLTTVVNKCSMRYTLIVGGDFNTRTKLSNQMEIEQCQNILGRYARSNNNSNGRNLIEFCKMYNVKLTNTLYKYKPSQQVTWTSEKTTKPQNNRKNPYHFQIDYIAIRKNQGIKIYDARSINTMRITTDHKPVVTFLKIHLSKSKPSATEKSLNIASVRDINNLELYKNRVEEYISHYNQPETPQDKWNNTVSATINAAKETVGYKSKTEIYQNPMIKHLSEK